MSDEEASARNPGFGSTLSPQARNAATTAAAATAAAAQRAGATAARLRAAAVAALRACGDRVAPKPGFLAEASSSDIQKRLKMKL